MMMPLISNMLSGKVNVEKKKLQSILAISDQCSVKKHLLFWFLPVFLEGLFIKSNSSEGSETR